MTNPTNLTNLHVTEALLNNTTVTTKTTAGAVTYTAAEVKGGLILRDPNGGNRSDIFPTASELYETFGRPKVGQTFKLHIRNTADAAETITMTTATGLTLSGTMTIAQNNAKDFVGVFTSSTAVTIYSLGTVVF